MTGFVMAARSEADAGWLDALRARGAARHEALGLPKTRREAWRYFPTRPLSQVLLSQVAPAAPADAVSAATLAPWRIAGAAGTAVFVDGHLAPELSDLGALAQRVRVGGLAAVLAADPSRVAPHLGHLAPSDSDGLVAANEAWFGDGLFVEVPAGVVIEAPIVALFVSTGRAPGAVRHPRNLIVMGRSSQATVVCRYVGLGDDEAGVTNAVTELALSDNASLRHVKLQEEAADTFHVAQIGARLAADARLRSYVVSLGAAAARTAIRAELAGQGAECSLDGLYLGAAEQRLDHYTEIDHLVGHTTSSEYYAGVMDDRSVGNFQGVVFIREGAVKSATEQLNRNLLLAPGARANSKPQLEIDNDDVAATHGATVGQLDAAALFYLESRGIAPATARAMLTFAFAREALEGLGERTIIDALVPRLLAKLDGPASPEFAAGSER